MKLTRQIKEKGQAALIVLLVVAVALGFGLSIISQSTTDVRISHQEQESARAFNAAEAGIEEALKNISSVGVGTQLLTGLPDEVEASYTVTQTNQIEALYKENDTVQINLADHDGSLTLATINWVNENSSIEKPDCVGDENNTSASLEVTIIQDASANYTKRSFAYNSCDLDNGMTYVSEPGVDNYLRQKTVDIKPADVLMRIRPIYNQASMYIYGNGDGFPAQGYNINSVAQVFAGEETISNKAIEVTRTEPGNPAIFDYVLFSGTNLVK